MRKANRLFIQVVIAGFMIQSCAPSVKVAGDVSDSPVEMKSGIDTRALAYASSQIAAGDSTYIKPYVALKKISGEFLELEPPSVMDKEMVPPSGDQHDYTSMGPYWWPDPETDDGLPYIRRDGEINPERRKFDKVPGATMAEAVRALAAMYHFTGDEKYAAKASEFLEVWFINPETRMNPNLNFGQFVPGLSDGRSVGIIESRNFVFLTDYEPLLSESPSWTNNDHLQFKAWMKDFLNWLETSELGQKERQHLNNHGSWCDYQLLALSQYCDEPELGRKVAFSIQTNRLARQINKAGEQPEELARTKSFNYSVFNLEALIRIAIISENYGYDLSNFDDKPSRIKAAIDYLLPFATGLADWEHTQITGMQGGSEKMLFLLAYARSKWPSDIYANALRQLVMTFPESPIILTSAAAHGNV